MKKLPKNIYNATGFGKTNLEMKDISVLKDIEKYINIFQEPILIPNLYIFESICNEAKENDLMQFLMVMMVIM